jgi:hypothetical protein
MNREGMSMAAKIKVLIVSLIELHVLEKVLLILLAAALLARSQLHFDVAFVDFLLQNFWIKARLQ